MRQLITKTSEEIMSTLYKPTIFAVEGLLAQGLFILAGSPRDLFRFAYDLQNFGVTFTPKRSNRQRLLLLNYDKNSDSSDGKKLMPEQHTSSVPAEQFTDPVLSENFIDAVAHMLSNKLLAQGIKVRPFEGCKWASVECCVPD